MKEREREFKWSPYIQPLEGAHYRQTGMPCLRRVTGFKHKVALWSYYCSRPKNLTPICYRSVQALPQHPACHPAAVSRHPSGIFKHTFKCLRAILKMYMPIMCNIKTFYGVSAHQHALRSTKMIRIMS